LLKGVTNSGICQFTYRKHRQEHAAELIYASPSTSANAAQNLAQSTPTSAPSNSSGGSTSSSGGGGGRKKAAQAAAAAAAANGVHIQNLVWSGDLVAGRLGLGPPVGVWVCGWAQPLALGHRTCPGPSSKPNSRFCRHKVAEKTFLLKKKQGAATCGQEK